MDAIKEQFSYDNMDFASAQAIRLFLRGSLSLRSIKILILLASLQTQRTLSGLRVNSSLSIDVYGCRR